MSFIPLHIRKRISFATTRNRVTSPSNKHRGLYFRTLELIFGIRRNGKTILIVILLATLLIHILLLRHHSIITLNHTKIVQVLTNQVGISSKSLGQENPGYNANMDGGQEISISATDNEKPKKILIWNKYWNSKALWHKVFSQIIHGSCPESHRGNNCQFTMNRSEIGSSDAVLFHLVDLHTNGEYKLPPAGSRSPNQLWIAMSYEPSFILKYVGLDPSKLNGIFNRTMSYRKDADIVVRHGRFLKFDPSQATISTTTLAATSNFNKRHPRFVSNWIHSHDQITERNYAHGKRRLVAWFASSHGCTSHSKRELYVSQLQKHIPVDIYGSCGQFKCGVQKTLRNPYKVEHDDCYYLVSLAYKFVLAFENSICADYITEKLYNNLMLNVIPIVLGGGNYSLAAPPNSVIDASQFSPKELADYLTMLDSNDTMYNQYFDWKKDYYIEAYDGVPMACDLCIKLNNNSWNQESKVYQDFPSWLEGNCSKGYEPT